MISHPVKYFSINSPVSFFSLIPLICSHLPSKIRPNPLPPTHLKIIALKLDLENNRKHIEAAPQGSMEIALPIPVQTDADTITFDKNAEGVIMLIADLRAFSTSYTTKKNEFVCKFEKF